MPVGCFLFGRGMKGEKEGGDVAQVGRCKRRRRRLRRLWLFRLIIAESVVQVHPSPPHFDDTPRV